MAERMSAEEFARAMKQFYESATDVLIQTDAYIDKLVADEVIGLYFPLFAGRAHACRAVEAARELLRATGYGNQAAPLSGGHRRAYGDGIRGYSHRGRGDGHGHRSAGP